MLFCETITIFGKTTKWKHHENVTIELLKEKKSFVRMAAAQEWNEGSLCGVWCILSLIFMRLRRKTKAGSLMEHHGETLLGCNGAVAGAPGAVGGARGPADS